MPSGMQCPSCQNTDSRVLESRAADGGRSVRRRRECLNCEFRFTTYERVETVPITLAIATLFFAIAFRDPPKIGK